MERALIIEDEETSAKMLSTIVESNGFRVDRCANGLMAVEAFRNALYEGNPYKIIFCDILMPELDGHGTVQKIRQREDEQGIPADQQVYIVMTSQLDDASNYAVALFKDRANSYLAKPFSTQDIVQEIQRMKAA